MPSTRNKRPVEPQGQKKQRTLASFFTSSSPIALKESSPFKRQQLDSDPVIEVKEKRLFKCSKADVQSGLPSPPSPVTPYTEYREEESSQEPVLHSASTTPSRRVSDMFYHLDEI